MNKDPVSETQQFEAIAPKRILLVNMRQELIPPINVIIGYAEMLREEARGSGQKELFFGLNQIRVAGKRLLSIVNAHLGASARGTIRLDFDAEGVRAALSAEMSPSIDEITECCAALLTWGTGQIENRLVADLQKIAAADERLRGIVSDFSGAAGTAPLKLAASGKRLPPQPECRMQPRCFLHCPG
jgi:signal transduction histidine kinase